MALSFENSAARNSAPAMAAVLLRPPPRIRTNQDAKPKIQASSSSRCLTLATTSTCAGKTQKSAAARFAAPSGTPVLSVANGVVRSTEYDGSYGNKIVVALEDGTEIWYAHLTSFTVSPGQEVRGGEQIGTVGSTGNSTGPHLHLEVRPGAGDAVDPYAALLAHGLTP